MPIYEYSCQKCKAHIEIIQKGTDKPLTRCRKCGGKLEKEWSQTSFQLKGSGWYVTDYAAKRGDAKDGKEKSSEAASTRGDAKDGKEKKSSEAASTTESAATSSETTKKDKSSTTPRASKE